MNRLLRSRSSFWVIQTTVCEVGFLNVQLPSAEKRMQHRVHPFDGTRIEGGSFMEQERSWQPMK